MNGRNEPDHTDLVLTIMRGSAAARCASPVTIRPAQVVGSAGNFRPAAGRPCSTASSSARSSASISSRSRRGSFQVPDRGRPRNQQPRRCPGHGRLRLRRSSAPESANHPPRAALNDRADATKQLPTGSRRHRWRRRLPLATPASMQRPLPRLPRAAGGPQACKRSAPSRPRTSRPHRRRPEFDTSRDRI
jgi:hypothetical protein